MELLEQTTFKDTVHYLLAFLLTVICGVCAFFAADRLRLVILMGASLAEFQRWGFRLTDQVIWYVLGVLWFIYVLAVEHAHRSAVTQARIRRARDQTMPVWLNDRPVLRWLWEHDLHLAFARFLRLAAISVGVWMVALLVSQILQAIVAN